MSLAAGAGIGLTSGRALFGGVGAVAGAAVGALAGIWCFFTVILPWRTRRVLPFVIDRAGGRTFDEVRLADERIKRMIDAASRRDAGRLAGRRTGARPRVPPESRRLPPESRDFRLKAEATGFRSRVQALPNAMRARSACSSCSSRMTL